MRVQGIEGMSREQVQFEVQRGARFVFYYYCISVLVLTFRRPSDIYFLKSGENAVVKGLPWTLLTLLLGWWGMPWGPIYSVQSLVVNLGEGKERYLRSPGSWNGVARGCFGHSRPATLGSRLPAAAIMSARRLGSCVSRFVRAPYGSKSQFG